MHTLKLSSYLVALVGVFLVVGTLIAYAAATGRILPTADGTYQDWHVVPYSATSSPHYTQVDESICNGTADYVRARHFEVGARDSFVISLSDVPNGALITEIEIETCASRDSGTAGGSTVLDVFYRLSGVDSSDEGDYDLPVGNTPAVLGSHVFSDIDVIKTASSTLEIGAVYTSGTKGARVSRMTASITYEE